MKQNKNKKASNKQKKKHAEDMAAFRSLTRKYPWVRIEKVSQEFQMGQVPAELHQQWKEALVSSPGKAKALESYPKENRGSSESLLIISIGKHSEHHREEKKKSGNIGTHFMFLRYRSNLCRWQKVSQFQVCSETSRLRHTWWWWVPGILHPITKQTPCKRRETQTKTNRIAPGKR